MVIKSVPSSARNYSKLQLDIDIPVAVIPPKGSTHFRLVHALCVTSDIEYEPALEGYVPVAHKVDGMNALSHSEYISLEQQRANVTFETALDAERIPDNATVVEVMGIDFYQALASVYEPFTQGRAAMVVGVF